MDSVETINEQKTYYNWPLAAQCIVLLTLFALLFQESIAPLFVRWIKWDQDLSHGIPTLFAFLFLVLRAPPLIDSRNTKSVSVLLVATIALLSLAWLVFIIANITIFANVALLLCIPLVIAASYSTASLRALLPIIGVLFFTLPIFGQLNNLLVTMSASAVGFLINLFGMTALLDGQNIFIPSGHIYIADGCSGLRYLSISILLGYLLSILNHYSLRGSIITLAIATALGLLTNWLRIFLLVVIGDLTEMKSSLMQDHEFFGWVLFCSVMFPAIFFAPIKPTKKILVEASPKPKPALALLALLIGPVLLALIPNTQHTIQQFTLAALTFPKYPEILTSPLALKAPKGLSDQNVQFQQNGINIYAHLSEYRPNNIKEKIIPYLEDIYDREEWKIVQRQLSPELTKQGFQSSVMMRAFKQEYLVLIYRFEVGAYNADDYQTAKILQIPATFAGKRYSNFISLHSICKNKACAEEIKATSALALEWSQRTESLR